MNGKVLLADDEPHITRNLEKVVPWEMLGLAVAGTAKNGLEALELLEKEPVDLLLCDIRMPLMDGLELIRQIREKGLDCDVIMLSGYQDFAYTRTAIQYGVKDYILKPIPYDELTGVIARVMSARRSRERQRQEERQKRDRMLDLVSEKLLYDILMDYSEASEDHWLYAADDRQLLSKRYALIVLDMDLGSEEARDWREWTDKERKLWNFAVCNVLRDKLRQSGLQHAVIQMRDGEWSVLVACGEDVPCDRAIVQEWAETMLAAVRTHVKLSLHAGIYGGFVSAAGLSAAYKAVQQGMLLAPNVETVVAHTFGRPALPQANQAIWDIFETMIAAMKRGDAATAERELGGMIRQLRGMNELSIGRIKPMLQYFALNLIREMKEMGAVSRELEERLWRKLDRRFGIKELLSVIGQATDALGERSVDKKKQSERSMAEARSYLERNLCRDISVEETATHVGLSASYFSLLFKQTYGVTFIEFVTRERMEKAKRMLAETTLSITQIAKDVGYAERRYFTKVFMKYAGDNPSDYRSKHAKELTADLEENGTETEK